MMMAAAIGGLIAPAAQAAENIACVESGYPAAAQGEINRFLTGFSIDTFSKDGPPEALMNLLVDRTKLCADTHGWSNDAAIEALTYQLAALAGKAVEGVATIKPAQWTKVRAAYRATDAGTVDLLRHVFNGTAKTPFEAKAADGAIQAIGAKAGVPASDSTSELLSGWLAAQIMRDDAQKKFAAN